MNLRRRYDFSNTQKKSEVKILKNKKVFVGSTKVIGMIVDKDLSYIKHGNMSTERSCIDGLQYVSIQTGIGDLNSMLLSGFVKSSSTQVYVMLELYG